MTSSIDQKGSGACPAEWRIIPSYPAYEASNLGQIRKRSNGRLMRLQTDQEGYLRLSIWRDGKKATRRVNRLVCEAFHGPAGSDMLSCHLDGSRDNARHSIEHGTFVGNTAAAAAANRGRRGHGAKFSDAQVEQIRRMSAEGNSTRAIARAFGCCRATAHKIVSGEHYAF